MLEIKIKVIDYRGEEVFLILTTSGEDGQILMDFPDGSSYVVPSYTLIKALELMNLK